MGRVTSCLLVLFHGEGAGTDDLTWAPEMICQTTRDTGGGMNIGGTVPRTGWTACCNAVSTG